ncbi:bacillithiol biosynthesis cysteine-adding enzyme BshC [Crocinitomix catalasitica]|uniref:bacillithiol biosynthesis cysteine-adding enzyme BshC n=1 Tax=Crocinitomix catalasitica TaxID=184607 RepID=UPI000686C4E3|nr:bacillithiol biosynthesis cysteine-adding enzyme BshC [Crocinitomix catalasitica]
MITKEYSFEELKFSSQLVRDLIQEKEPIKQFINDFYSAAAISEQIKQKPFSVDQRVLLNQQLIKQNSAVELTVASQKHIDAILQNNTYTITTGHQLNLLTGPLYTIYKIAQVIKIANQKAIDQPEMNFVPVFWMATEDHDFEEINHLHLFGKKIEWENEVSKGKIVGAIELDSMNEFLATVEDKYQDESLKEVLIKLTNAYKTTSNLAEATRELVNQLFGEYGIVILDGNDQELKKAFAPIAKKEVEEELVFSTVDKTNAALEELGYHQQVYLRECNLFYIDEHHYRQRIAKTDDGFLINEKAWTKEEVLNAIDDNPAQFSPNALLRPVYQECILPNLVYVGGGGEIAYWLQLKGVFEALNIPYPLLRVRDSFLLVRESEEEQLAAINMSIFDLKENLEMILKELALANNADEIQLDDERQVLKAVKEKLVEKSNVINKGLNAMVEAEFAKFEKTIDKIQASFIKSEKGKLDKERKRIESLQAKFFPGGSFQERFDNFIPYHLQNDAFIADIMALMSTATAPKVNIVRI